MSILLTGIGVLIVIFGLLVRFAGMVELLSGYDEKKVTDKEGLKSWAGCWLIISGIVLVVGGFFEPLYGEPVQFIVWGLFLLCILILIAGAQRFSRK